MEIDETHFFNLLQDLGVTKLIIDTRTTEEYQKSHARASVSIPLKEEENLEEYMNRHKSLKSRGLVYPKLIFYGSNFSLLNQLSSFLEKEGKVKKVYLVKDYSSFEEKYPFMLTSNTFQSDQTLYPTEIIPNFLYLGSYDTAKNKRQLKNLKVTHILNMASELEYEFEKGDFEYFKCDGNYLLNQSKADDVDGFDLEQFFEESLNFIHSSSKKENARIFVHCNMGISRSTSIVIAYLLKYKKMKIKDSLQFIKENRSFVNPRSTFMEQLSRLEEKWLFIDN
jgi:protein-tyrosine phosphatase/rhodanese-related sulfurtransferase